MDTPEDLRIRHHRVKEVFNSVLDVPIAKRPEKLDALCAGDTLLRLEVERLLEFHNSSTLLPVRRGLSSLSSSLATASVQTFISSRFLMLRRLLAARHGRLWLALFGIQLLLMGLTVFAMQHSRREVAALSYRQLESTLQSQISYVTNALEQHVQATKQLPLNTGLVNGVDILQTAIEKNPDEDLAVNYGTGIIIAVAPQHFPRVEVDGNNVVKVDRPLVIFNSDGLILLESNAKLVRQHLSRSALHAVADVFDNKMVIATSSSAPEFNRQMQSGEPEPFLWSVVPLHSGKWAAAVGYPLHELAESFQQSIRSLVEVDCYAFDVHGVALSKLYFEESLHANNLLPQDQTAAFHFTLRDPGIDLTRPQGQPDRWESQPLTLAIRAAIANQEINFADRYRNYCGLEVFGVSKWLPDFQMGIVAETTTQAWLNTTQPWLTLVWTEAGLFTATACAAVLTWGIGRRRRHQFADHIGSYKILSRIDDGGMGSVYLAEHPRLSLPVAIKVLREDVMRADTIKRLKREAVLAAKLTCPHSVQIYDYDVTEDGRPYFVMRYAEGTPLNRLTDKSPLEEQRALKIWKQLVLAVAEAHSYNLLHRDIKPQNIIVGRKGVQDDFATLLDFGLVKSLDVVKDDTLTGPLTWAGTPKYSPPERIAQPSNADMRTDVYGLGIVLYRMLAGRDPFTGDHPEELFAKILTQSPPDVQQFAAETISSSTLDLLQKCLAKDPDQRPASALVLLQQIESLQ